MIGDALVELGRYREAFAAFDRMAALQPSLSSYARVSYARELLGDTAGAIAAMQLAVDAAAGAGRADGLDARPARQALLVSAADSRAAEREYRVALAVFPATLALDALAQVEAARGDYAPRDRARAAGRRRDPAAAVRRTLGDLYARHRPAEARAPSSTR